MRPQVYRVARKLLAAVEKVLMVTSTLAEDTSEASVAVAGSPVDKADTPVSEDRTHGPAPGGFSGASTSVAAAPVAGVTSPPEGHTEVGEAAVPMDVDA